MQKDAIRKRLSEFLDSEKSGDGKKVGKAFREGLVGFISDIVYEEVKAVKDAMPMKESLPEADASVMSHLPFDIGEDVFYVIFKQVRSQVKGKLTVKFGWQFTVLRGRTEEIQIRNDHGVLYKVNGDWVLKDLIFRDESLAVARCNRLNAGTESYHVEGAEEIKTVRCLDCVAIVNIDDVHEVEGGFVCSECLEKRKVEEVANGNTDGESISEVNADGKEVEAGAGSSVDNGGSGAGGEADRNAD